MADEQNSTQQSAPIETPTAPGNSPEARTPDGTLINQSTQNPPSGTSDAKQPDAPAPTGAPEKYEFKAPEGKTLDQAAIDAAIPIFKELNLSQAQADKLMSVWNGRVDAFNKNVTETVDKMRADWRTQINNDSEMSGRLDKVKADLGTWKDVFLGPKGSDSREKFDAAMNLTGAGDHPDIVKGWWKAAQKAIEGKHVTGSGPSPNGQTAPNQPKPTLAQQMYPHLPSGNA